MKRLRLVLLLALLPLQSCGAINRIKAEPRKQRIPYIEVTLISIPW